MHFRKAKYLTNAAALGWSPTALGSSLLAWWDAERSDLITQSGGLVSSWKDIVAGYDMANTTGAEKPVYSATSFNGRPGVTFDGSDDNLTLASQPFPSAANPSESWVLSDQNALAADATARISFSYGATGLTLRRMGRTVIAAANNAFSESGDGATQIGSNNTTVDFSGRHVHRSQFKATAVQADVDATAGPSIAVVPNTGTTRARMGANASAITQIWSGTHNTVLVTLPLSAAQATQLYAYLNRRL